MKISEKELIDKAEDAVRACLENIPFIKILEIRRYRESVHLHPDLWIKLGMPYGEQDIIAEVKSNGEPRSVREAANQLLKFRYAAPPGTYGILVAPFVSSRGAEICAQEKIGHVDLSGNCSLSFGHIYIERRGNPNLFAQKRNLRSLYSPRAERVLRVLLSNPHEFWNLQKLADEAEVSLGQVSNVKRMLSDREWIEPEHGRIRLIKPIELLSEWAANYDFKRNEVRDFYTLKDPYEFEADLAEWCAKNETQYAFTGFSGAARLAPAVRYQRTMAYVSRPPSIIATLMNLKEVPGGANVRLLIPYDKGVYYGMKAVNTVWASSPIQTYLDLCSIKGRGEEAAQVILDEVIKPLW